MIRKSAEYKKHGTPNKITVEKIGSTWYVRHYMNENLVVNHIKLTRYAAEEEFDRVIEKVRGNWNVDEVRIREFDEKGFVVSDTEGFVQ